MPVSKRWTAAAIALVIGLGVGYGGSTALATGVGAGGGKAGATVPADLCAFVGSQRLAVLVPAAGAPTRRAYHYSTYNTGSCQVRTDDDKATTFSAGDLTVEVSRFGSASKASGDLSSDQARKPTEDETRRDVTGLGDRAFARVFTYGDYSYESQVYVLRGTDVVHISYHASPSNGDKTTAAASAVAALVLAGLS